MHQNILIGICLGFLVGVAGYFLLNIFGLIIIVFLVILFLIFFKIPKRFFLMALFCSCLLIGFFYAQFFNHNHQQRLPEKIFNHTEIIVGKISSDPDLGLARTQVTVQMVSINGEFLDTRTPDRILVTLPAGSDVSYGDTISFSGKIKHPEIFMTDTDREFDYPHYLMIRNIFGTVTAKQFKIVSSHGSFLKILFSIKKYFVQSIAKLFPSPESGLFAGIVIGEKSLLPANNSSDMQIAGLTHMIVLSGYNITIVALFAITILSWFGFGYRARRIGALVMIPLFVIMTGMGASSVRAAIMSMIVFILQLDSRPVSVTRIILLTLVGMTIANPMDLIWDPSLHLSFLAFLGLAYASPIVDKLLSRAPEFLGLRDLAIETLGVQIVVLPYLLWMSGRVSLLLFIANFLTVPLTPLVMGAGFFATMISMIPFFKFAAQALAFPVKIILAYTLSISHIVASIQVTTFLIPVFSGWWMVGGYLVLVIGLVLLNKKLFIDNRSYLI